MKTYENAKARLKKVQNAVFQLNMWKLQNAFKMFEIMFKFGGFLGFLP